MPYIFLYVNITSKITFRKTYNNKITTTNKYKKKNEKQKATLVCMIIYNVKRYVDKPNAALNR